MKCCCFTLHSYTEIPAFAFAFSRSQGSPSLVVSSTWRQLPGLSLQPRPLSSWLVGLLDWTLMLRRPASIMCVPSELSAHTQLPTRTLLPARRVGHSSVNGSIVPKVAYREKLDSTHDHTLSHPRVWWSSVCHSLTHPSPPPPGLSTVSTPVHWAPPSPNLRLHLYHSLPFSCPRG